ILVSNAARLEPGFQILCATDRTARFVFLEAADERPPRPLTRWFARTSTLAWLKEKAPADLDGPQIERIEGVLERGEVLGLPRPAPECDGDRAAVVERAFAAAARRTPAPVVPVCYESGEPDAGGVRPVHIIFGSPLPAGTGLEEAREAVRQLGDNFREQSGS